MSKTINDGGPAFPTPGFSNLWSNPSTPGMSLRAWLAGQALTGIMANGDQNITWSVDNIAAHCVDFADAIINELNKP